MADKHPPHYTRGHIEVWDFIRDQKLNYHLGNAIKYISRAGFKTHTTKTSDLKKAIHYLENELQHTEATLRPSNPISSSVRHPEQSGEPDYANSFDR